MSWDVRSKSGPAEESEDSRKEPGSVSWGWPVCLQEVGLRGRLCPVLGLAEAGHGDRNSATASACCGGKGWGICRPLGLSYK